MQQNGNEVQYVIAVQFRFLSISTHKTLGKGKGAFMDWKPITELWSVTCHMGSHSVTCYPTHVNAPHLNPSHAGRYLIYLPRSDGRLS